MIEAVLLDYGGTLDTGGDHWYCVMADAYRARGMELSREAYIAGEREAARAVRPDMGLADTLAVKVRAQGCAEPDAVAADLYAHAARCVAAAAVQLDRLAARLPLALVSNFYGNLDTVAHELGIRRYFSVLTDSTVAGVRKPDPAIFSLTLDALGVAAAGAAVIGDSVANDLVPAASLGCVTARVTGRTWPWAAESTAFAPRYSGTLEELASALLAEFNV